MNAITTKERRMLRRVIYSASLAVCVIAGLATAQPEPPPPWARWEQRVRHMDLTAPQKEKVTKILDESRKERESLQALIRQTSAELNQLLQQPNFSEQAVLKQADKLGALRTERQKAMLRSFLKVRAELTPEQRRQLLAKTPSEGTTPRRPLTAAPNEKATPATPAETP
jgi:Spy/CpxP family protein refolding chaperone